MEVVLLVWNMVRRSCIPKFFSETKVDDVDKVGRLAGAHNEIGRLDVAMNERIRVDELDSRDLKTIGLQVLIKVYNTRGKRAAVA